MKLMNHLHDYNQILKYLTKQLLENLREENRSDNYIQGKIDLIHEIFNLINKKK